MFPLTITIIKDGKEGGREFNSMQVIEEFSMKPKLFQNNKERIKSKLFDLIAVLDLNEIEIFRKIYPDESGKILASLNSEDVQKQRQTRIINTIVKRLTSPKDSRPLNDVSLSEIHHYSDDKKKNFFKDLYLKLSPVLTISSLTLFHKIFPESFNTMLNMLLLNSAELNEVLLRSVSSNMLASIQEFKTFKSLINQLSEDQEFSAYVDNLTQSFAGEDIVNETFDPYCVLASSGDILTESFAEDCIEIFPQLFSSVIDVQDKIVQRLTDCFLKNSWNEDFSKLLRLNKGLLIHNLLSLFRIRNKESQTLLDCFSGQISDFLSQLVVELLENPASNIKDIIALLMMQNSSGVRLFDMLSQQQKILEQFPTKIGEFILDNEFTSEEKIFISEQMEKYPACLISENVSCQDLPRIIQIMNYFSLNKDIIAKKIFQVKKIFESFSDTWVQELMATLNFSEQHIKDEIIANVVAAFPEPFFSENQIKELNSHNPSSEYFFKEKLGPLLKLKDKDHVPLIHHLVQKSPDASLELIKIVLRFCRTTSSADILSPKTPEGISNSTKVHFIYNCMIFMEDEKNPEEIFKIISSKITDSDDFATCLSRFFINTPDLIPIKRDSWKNFLKLASEIKNNYSEDDKISLFRFLCRNLYQLKMLTTSNLALLEKCFPGSLKIMLYTLLLSNEFELDDVMQSFGENSAVEEIFDPYSILAFSNDVLTEHFAKKCTQLFPGIFSSLTDVQDKIVEALTNFFMNTPWNDNFLSLLKPNNDRRLSNNLVLLLKMKNRHHQTLLDCVNGTVSDSLSRLVAGLLKQSAFNIESIIDLLMIQNSCKIKLFDMPSQKQKIFRQFSDKIGKLISEQRLVSKDVNHQELQKIVEIMNYFTLDNNVIEEQLPVEKILNSFFDIWAQEFAIVFTDVSQQYIKNEIRKNVADNFLEHSFAESQIKQLNLHNPSNQESVSLSNCLIQKNSDALLYLIKVILAFFRTISPDVISLLMIKHSSDKTVADVLTPEKVVKLAATFIFPEELTNNLNDQNQQEQTSYAEMINRSREREGLMQLQSESFKNSDNTRNSCLSPSFMSSNG